MDGACMLHNRVERQPRPSLPMRCGLVTQQPVCPSGNQEHWWIELSVANWEPQRGRTRALPSKTWQSRVSWVRFLPPTIKIIWLEHSKKKKNWWCLALQRPCRNILPLTIPGHPVVLKINRGCIPLRHPHEQGKYARKKLLPSAKRPLGDGEGQESLVCYSPLGRKESDTTALPNNKKDSQMVFTV